MLIRKVDRQPKTKTEAVLLTDGPAYALLYLTLLKKLQRIDTMQSILVLIADALAGIAQTLDDICKSSHEYCFRS